MYEQRISRKHPGCIIFLLDRSDSMKRQWEGNRTLAEGAAQALNDVLRELCVEGRKERGVVYHYFDIGIFGYGLRPIAGGEGVESAFGGKLTGYALAPLPELNDNPVAVREVSSIDQTGTTVLAPVWVEPVYGYRTPMCEAMSVAGQYAFDWARSNPDSFPPIIINITDGWVTDEPHQGAGLAEWAQRLTTIETRDGGTLLFNIFLSPDKGDQGDQRMLPATHKGLPDPGPQLFQASSALPQPMIANANAAGITAEPGARGFAFNANLKMLSDFLKIGTNVGVQDRDGS
jgi:hypothetical protein